MRIRKREDNQTVWDAVSGMLPNRIILEIEFWRGDFYRVMVESGDGVSFFIIDLAYRIIALEGYRIQTAGYYLKLINKGEGLIEPFLKSVRPPLYQWRTIIPCDYSQIVDHLDGAGLIRVIKDNKWGIIDGFNNTVVPLEYNHLSPIYPLVDGRYKVIATKTGEPEHNLYINKSYTIQEGNHDVPVLQGLITDSFEKAD